MQKRTRSILAELDSLSLNKEREHFIETRAANVISGAVNLLQYIRENYDHETAGELERRLINSIRSGDASKFSRGIRRLKDENY